MKTLKIILFLFIAAFTWSCEEDFEINAPYKDITIVYGLLDQGQDSIFLKINKAFLGDGDVMEMAKIEDSSAYVNRLDAYVEEWQNGNMIRAYQLDTITIANKEDGVFYNPYQVAYFTPYEPDPERLYRLSVYVNGKIITAQTRMVQDFAISKPSAGSKFIQFRPDTDGEIEWESAENGKRYEVVIRFKYKEVMVGSTDTIYKYVDWAMGTKKSVTDEGGEEMLISYSNDAFYTFIGNEIPYEDPSTEENVRERYTNDVDFIIAVAAGEFNTYLEVNEPSNSIVQDRPEYTNITNGIGLFSSRYKNIRTKKLHPETINTIQNTLPELKFAY